MGLTSLQTAASSNEGRKLAVLHPEDKVPLFAGEGEGKVPVTITLQGRDSDTYIRAERSNRELAFDQMTRKGKFKAAEQDHRNDALLAACTTTWTGIPKGWIDGTDDETPVEFSRESALALYANPGVKWLREQVDEFVGERANFLPSSPTGSSPTPKPSTPSGL